MAAFRFTKLTFSAVSVTKCWQKVGAMIFNISLIHFFSDFEMLFTSWKQKADRQYPATDAWSCCNFTRNLSYLSRIKSRFTTMFCFALGRPVKQNYDINATISDVLEPRSYFIKLFKNLGIKKYIICSKNVRVFASRNG